MKINSKTSVTSPIVEKVAIIGAGLGGLATAIALRKQGIDGSISTLGSLETATARLVIQLV